MGHHLAAGRHPVDQGEDQPAQRVGLVAILARPAAAGPASPRARRARPGRRRRSCRPGSRPAAAAPARSCSSASSPTSSSTRSSMVTRPSVPPNSSTTTAMRLLVRAHLEQQVEHPHRRRHHQHRAHGLLEREGVAVAPERQQVLEVDDAQHVVEIVAVDHQPRVAAPPAWPRRRRAGRSSIATPLMSARGTMTSSTRSSPKLSALRTSSRSSSLNAVAALLLGLGDQLLERLAQTAGLGLAAPGELAHAAHEAVEQRGLRRARAWPAASCRGLRRVGVGDAEPGQQLDLPRLHPLRLVVVLVIVAQEVQRAVDDEVGQMVGAAACPSAAASRAHGLQRDDDIAQEPRLPRRRRVRRRRPGKESTLVGRSWPR